MSMNMLTNMITNIMFTNMLTTPGEELWRQQWWRCCHARVGRGRYDVLSHAFRKHVRKHVRTHNYCITENCACK